MLNIISNSNLNEIKDIADNILSLIKSKKIFILSDYNQDVRVKASSTLLELSRAFRTDYRFSSIEVNEDTNQLKTFVESLSSLLENKTKFMTFKFKDYSLDIKPKLCKELISDLEDFFILGQIDRNDINDIYSTLNKPVPKKFSSNDLQENSKNIFYAIRNEIKEQADEIKANSIQHYADMTNIIDPDSSIDNPKEFYKTGRAKISDMNSLRLCLAYKFDNDKFYDLINNEFDTLLTVAANQISNFSKCDDNDADINVKNVTLGGKGFDISMTVNQQPIYARAIPVNGMFVRFHYRYIIT